MFDTTGAREGTSTSIKPPIGEMAWMAGDVETMTYITQIAAQVPS